MAKLTKEKWVALISAIAVIVTALIVVLIMTLGGKKPANNGVNSSAHTEAQAPVTTPEDKFDPYSLAVEGSVYVIATTDTSYTVYTLEGDTVTEGRMYIDCGTSENAEKTRRAYQMMIDGQAEDVPYTAVSVNRTFFVGIMTPASYANQNRASVELLWRVSRNVKSSAATEPQQ